MTKPEIEKAINELKDALFRQLDNDKILEEAKVNAIKLQKEVCIAKDNLRNL
jgi:hypothetical protein